MIARKSALIILSRIINGLLGYIGLYFITRYMSPSDYGIVSFAIGFVTLFSIFTDLGFQSAHIKRVSEGKKIERCVGTFLTIRLSLISISFILIIGFLYLWTTILGRGFETPTHLSAIYIILGFWIIRQFAETLSVTFKAKKEIAHVQIPILLNDIFRTIAIITVALMDLGPLILAWTYLFGEIIQLLTISYFSTKIPISKPSKEYIKNYAIFAFPLLFVSMSNIIMTNIDKVLIQLFWNAESVGHYAAAFRLSNFIAMFSASIGILIFPTFSTFHSKGNTKGIKELCSSSMRHLSIVVFPMVFGLMILAEPATYILLSNWKEAGIILRIMPLFALFKAFLAVYTAVFNGLNKPKINRNCLIIMVTSNVTLNFLLIPRDIQSIGLKLFGLGAIGATIATVISFSIGLMYYLMISRKYPSIKTNPRIILHAIAAILMSSILYILLYSLNYITLLTRWYHLLLTSFFGLGIYLLLLIIFKEFSKKDLNFYLETLNIIKLYEYIKDEIKKK